MKKFVQIAIDGPAASGKSTIAKIVAQKLNYVYIDTGAMYRAITWAVINAEIDLDNEELISDLLSKIEIILTPDNQVFVNEQDVTEAVRLPGVTSLVSKVAAYQSVRTILKDRQVAMAKVNNVIMDGRDIGTNVLPNANYKFFMIADSRVRAQRRYDELTSKGIETDIDKLEEEIKKRDELDANREFAPLKQAQDAILIDTSALSIQEVVDKMVGYVLK